ncbi:hypothetical protein [Citrobacter freundii]|uniref:hypothetical protein n=1 Tax=Citrobacter freundii TaxID=546 RepID=UPI003C6F4586
MTVYEMEGFLRGKCLPGDMKVNESNAQYLVRKFSEFESNLSESRREFRAADATIHNLELKLTDIAVHLANAESKCREMAAREIKPAKGEVLVVVSGFTGCGKSAIAGEIEIAMKAIGVPVQWANGDAEKSMTGADWITAIEMYKPTVRIVEVNVPRAAGIGVKGE